MRITSNKISFLLLIVLCQANISFAAVTWDGTEGIFNNVIQNNGVENCTNCHSSTLESGDRSAAPLGVDYDTYDNAISGTNEQRAVVRVRAGSMPDAGALAPSLQTLISSWETDGYLENAAPELRTANNGTLTATSAVLNGGIQENGINTSARFVYWRSGTTEPTTCPTNSITSGCTGSTAITGTGGDDTFNTYSRTATGLSCGTSYLYRAISNANGTYAAQEAPTTDLFTTSACSAPIIETSAGAALGNSTTVAVAEDSVANTFLFQADDINGGTRTWSITETPNGSLSFNGGDNTTATTNEDIVLNYTPPNNIFGTAATSFELTVSDDSLSGALTDALTVNINITAVNDAPTLDTNTNGAAGELNTIIITSDRLEASDIDSSNNNIIYTLTSNLTRGTLRNGTTILSTGGANSFTQTDINNNDITYEEIANSGAGSDSFTFNLSDNLGAAGPSGQTFTINITDNATPVVSAGGALNFTENDNASLINETVSVSDAETDNIVSATVSISGNFAAEDSLALSNTALGLSGVFNAGTLSISGTASPAVYTTALRSITYSNTSDDPSTLTRTVSYQVSDSNGSSSVVTSSINVSAENDAPVISNSNSPTSNAIEEIAIAAFTPVFTDLDDTNNGTDLTWSLNNAPTGMTISSTGLIEWTPSEGQTSSGIVSIILEDGNEDNSVPVATTFSITVNPINDPPVISSTNAPANATELQAVQFSVSVNDPDDANDGSNLNWSLSNQPTGMTISPTGEINWTPPLGTTTSGNVSVSVEDGDEDNTVADSSNFTITVLLDDIDGDLISASLDNCPLASNPDQADLDNDGLGNVCDPDNNNDGLIDSGIKLEVTQNNIISPYIFTDVSPPTVSITALAAIEGIDFSNMSFTWETDTEVATLPSYQVSNNSISFDPTSLINGSRKNFNAKATISNFSQSISNSIIITVAPQSPTVLAYFDCNNNNINDGGNEELTGDCDNDSLANNDPLESFSDDNFNGIPDFLDDANLASNISYNLPLADNAQEIITSENTNLNLGSISRNANNISLLILAEDIENFGGENGTPSTVAIDSYKHPAGIFDFELAGIETNSTGEVVIPLSSSLTNNSIYRSYSSTVGWSDFVIDDNNSILSAAFINKSTQECPEINSTNYVSGLVAFSNCIKLNIQDGGPNDKDGTPNGVIRHTGAPSILSTGESSDTFDTVENGSGALAPRTTIFLLLLFALSLISKRVKTTKGRK